MSIPLPVKCDLLTLKSFPGIIMIKHKLNSLAPVHFVNVTEVSFERITNKYSSLSGEVRKKKTPDYILNSN
ncbi:hypothetical protein DN748_04675 [Sinomicrobium soli]|nr:hypothetical protein DN748_04675 [Sinomicrobium sp. N-1-3-6]